MLYYYVCIHFGDSLLKCKFELSHLCIQIFRRGGTLRRNLTFSYDSNDVEIVNKFTYLGVVFTTGGSLYETKTSSENLMFGHWFPPYIFIATQQIGIFLILIA